MNTLVALIAVVTVCVLARPSVPSFEQPESASETNVPFKNSPEKEESRAPGPFSLGEIIVSQYSRAPLPNYDNSDDGEAELEEIYKEMGAMEGSMDYNFDGPQYLTKLLPASEPVSLKYLEDLRYLAEELKKNYQNPSEYQDIVLRLSEIPRRHYIEDNKSTTNNPEQTTTLSSVKKGFALTPQDSGYYKEEDAKRASSNPENGVQENKNEAIEPRPIRQNPNLSRTKTLVAANIDKLRAGLSETSGSGVGTDKPDHIHVYDTGLMTSDPADSIYGIALLAAVGAALMMAIVGFAFGWYTLSKRAKAAADVDYPAYGVTGPTAELAGDRKLAHSAHMYHYQHQKQQILAMERSCSEQRNGSVSDPESEEENEEGDYTVYECPGFATTGAMEVKNPLFTEEKTPATPGKCELVKPQPQE